MMSKLLASKELCRRKLVCKLNYSHGAFDGSEILRSPPEIYKTLKNNSRFSISTGAGFLSSTVSTGSLLFTEPSVLP